MIDTICVIGAGTMGNGTAQSNFNTLLFDINNKVLEKASIAKKLILFLFFSLTTLSSFSQKTFWIRRADTAFFKNEFGNQIFKDSLPDGKYISYILKHEKSSEVTFKNGKRNGIENRYFLGNKNKYAVIQWKDGKRNGATIHYNTNGTIAAILNFKNDILDGHFIVNWSEGEKNYKGFYKNGFKDSIWTYYEEVGVGKPKQFKSKEVKYANGTLRVINVWDNKGHQIVKDGNTLIYNNYDYSYKNGLKEGKIFVKEFDSDSIVSMQTYSKGLLINEKIFYSYPNSICDNKSWSYDDVSFIDTVKDFVDQYITEFSCIEIKNKYVSRPDGKWTMYFKDGKLAYEGNYKNGNRISVWRFNYKTGNPKVIVDYSTNKWVHFDSAGIALSDNFSNEYLTAFIEHPWFINQSFDSNIVIMQKGMEKNISALYYFNYDGIANKFEVYECDGIHPTKETANYYLTTDRVNFKINNDKEYNFKIVSVSENKIVLIKDKNATFEVTKK